MAASSATRRMSASCSGCFEAIAPTSRARSRPASPPSRRRGAWVRDIYKLGRRGARQSLQRQAHPAGAIDQLGQGRHDRGNQVRIALGAGLLQLRIDFGAQGLKRGETPLASAMLCRPSSISEIRRTAPAHRSWPGRRSRLGRDRCDRRVIGGSGRAHRPVVRPRSTAQSAVLFSRRDAASFTVTNCSATRAVSALVDLVAVHRHQQQCQQRDCRRKRISDLHGSRPLIAEPVMVNASA